MYNKNVIDVLRQRTSCGQLEAPGPSPDQLNTLFEVAFRAADHHQLRPWRFLVIEGDALPQLGQLFLASQEKQQTNLSPEEKNRLLALPLRAPMVITVVASVQDNPKVPANEQLLATGAAVQNMLNAAFAMGLGAIWRTGYLAYDPDVAEGLGLSANEHIVAFLYLGTPKVPAKLPPLVEIKNHVKHWP